MRRGEPHHYATTQAQARLDFDPGGPALCPRPARSERQRELVSDLGARARRSSAVLQRLRQGPASSLDLIRCGGVRFHQRLHELRTRGYSIRARRESSGAWTYALLEEPGR